MARSRNIKPGYFMNEDLAALGMAAQLLFAGIWTIADREGRFEDRPARIKAQILPYYDVDVDELLNLLAENPINDDKFIIRYTVNGRKYIQITKFSGHQNPHKNEAPSIIPPYSEEAPEKHSTSTVQEQETHSTNPADSLNLVTDSLNPIIEKPQKEIFEHWNCKNIYIHRAINKHEAKIMSALKIYSIDEIKAGINNYAYILSDDRYYFEFKWTLSEFLQRGLERFMDLEIAKSNFRRREARAAPAVTGPPM